MLSRDESFTVGWTQTDLTDFINRSGEKRNARVRSLLRPVSRTVLHMYTYVPLNLYIYIYVYICLYIYIYIDSERNNLSPAGFSLNVNKYSSTHAPDVAERFVSARGSANPPSERIRILRMTRRVLMKKSFLMINY